MRSVTLYNTLGCHLCELAKEQIDPLIDRYDLRIEEIDIATNEELLKKYGVKIPVLRVSDFSEVLYWPFDTLAIDAILQKNI